MIEHILEKPWIAAALLLVLVLLYVGVAMRIRRDNRLKDRLAIDRRDTPRRVTDRRKETGERVG